MTERNNTPMTLVRLTNEELMFVKTTNRAAIGRLEHFQKRIIDNKVKRNELYAELSEIIKFMEEEYYYDD